MFDFFKNLFVNKQPEPANVFQQPAHASMAQPSKALTPGTTFRSRQMQPSARTVVSQVSAVSAPAAPIQTDGRAIEIPLSSILVALPMELKARVRPADIGQATFAVSLENVFSQLGTGSVKILFGELRQAAPQLFLSGIECDQVPVTLPLGEILSRVNPALLVRRQDQKQIEVPEEINSPFGVRGDNLIFAAGPKVSEATPPPRAVKPTAPLASSPVSEPDIFQPKPAVSRTRPPGLQASVSPSPVKPTPIRPATMPAPLTPPKPQAAPQQFRPAAFTPPPTPARAPIQPATPRPLAPAPQVQPQRPVETPLEAAPSIPSSAALRNLGKSIGITAPPTNTPTAQSARAQQASQPVIPAAEVPSLTVPLSSLAESWPEALRLEISQSHLSDARIGLPIAPVEEAMRRGKVTFPWKTIRSWIRPAPLPAVSAHDSIVLELPLKVLAPLFMARLKNGAAKKVVVDEKIPNLFFGFPQPEPVQQKPSVVPPVPAPAPVPAAVQPMAPAIAKPTETNYYVWNDSSEAANVDETEFKRKPSVETNFLSRYATPNEVVASATALEGVVGALVALPDGLKVASDVPADLNADTLAAFLPQIFGKVSQCTRELRMGDLNNLNFTVGNVPWKIFRVNAIFFAAFGRAGQGLPTAQLAEIAAKLDRKKQ